MIRPEDMAGFTDPMERIFLDLQNRIMEDVVRRIVKMGEITRTADMQMGTIRKLGGSTSFIRTELKRMAGLTDKELGRLFSDVIKKGYSDNAEIYRRMGRNFIPAAENRILQSWKKALTDQTAGELKNITRSLGMMWEVRGQKRLLPLADVYQQALDDAAMDIVSGGKSYNTVLRRTVSQLTRSGLRTVDYASGTSTRVEVASRRAVMTGVHQLTGQINLEVAKDLNTDYFEVTWHAGARPEHWWGGRVYSRQQLNLVCGYGTVEGLCGANCRHSFYAFIPGVSRRMYSDEQLAEMNAAEQVKKPYADGKSYTAYEATQKQRQMETVMRAQRERIHLLQQGGADDQEILLAKCRYQGEIQEYKRFSKAMGLPPQMDRVYIDGLGRKAPVVLAPKRTVRHANNTSVSKDMSNIYTARRMERLAARKRGLDNPDFSQMDATQLKKYIEEHLKTSVSGIDGANTEYIRETVKVLDQLEKKMGGRTIDGLTVQFGGLPQGVYAKYDDKTKTLLLKKTGNLTQFEEKLKADNIRFKTKWKTEKDYHATETYSGTIWHELGHAIDVESGQDLSRKLSANTALDEASVKVSAYAGTTQGVRVTKRSEAWAENFAAYMDGGRNKEKISTDIGKMIEDSLHRNESLVENSQNAVIIKPDKVISGHDGTPKKSDPNTVIDHLGNDGKTETRTFYGDDGYKKKDLTNHNHGNAKTHPYGVNGEHAHDYTWGEDGRLKDKTTRDWTEQERKENSDIL